MLFKCLKCESYALHENERRYLCLNCGKVFLKKNEAERCLTIKEPQV